MRIDVEIDDNLIEEARKASEAQSDREAIELGLRTLLRLRAQARIRDLRGKLAWEGDLDAMRTDK
jgi:Arc/MetJ family transcription regulator